jgi:hypothetical protein
MFRIRFMVKLLGVVLARGSNDDVRLMMAVGRLVVVGVSPEVKSGCALAQVSKDSGHPALHRTPCQGLPART